MSFRTCFGIGESLTRQDKILKPVQDDKRQETGTDSALLFNWQLNCLVPIKHDVF
jgi:hypothetical protein